MSKSQWIIYLTDKAPPPLIQKENGSPVSGKKHSTHQNITIYGLKFGGPNAQSKHIDLSDEYVNDLNAYLQNNSQYKYILIFPKNTSYHDYINSIKSKDPEIKFAGATFEISDYGESKYNYVFDTTSKIPLLINRELKEKQFNNEETDDRITKRRLNVSEFDRPELMNPELLIPPKPKA